MKLWAHLFPDRTLDALYTQATSILGLKGLKHYRGGMRRPMSWMKIEAELRRESALPICEIARRTGLPQRTINNTLAAHRGKLCHVAFTARERRPCSPTHFWRLGPGPRIS